MTACYNKDTEPPSLPCLLPLNAAATFHLHRWSCVCGGSCPFIVESSSGRVYNAFGNAHDTSGARHDQSGASRRHSSIALANRSMGETRITVHE
jgi:hypothetical protein